MSLRRGWTANRAHPAGDSGYGDNERGRDARFRQPHSRAATNGCAISDAATNADTDANANRITVARCSGILDAHRQRPDAATKAHAATNVDTATGEETDSDACRLFVAQSPDRRR